MKITENIKNVIIMGLNEKLKQAQNYNDLLDIENTIAELSNYDIYLYFIMKKTGYQTLDFTPYSIGFGKNKYTDENKVAYVIDDGVSTGKSLVKNLSRNIKIGE